MRNGVSSMSSGSCCPANFQRFQLVVLPGRTAVAKPEAEPALEGTQIWDAGINSDQLTEICLPC